jgi:hypothetical protein
MMMRTGTRMTTKTMRTTRMRTMTMRTRSASNIERGRLLGVAIG